MRSEGLPAISSEPTSTLRELFGRALEKAPDSREAFLDEVCRDDEALRRALESLLVHDKEAGWVYEREPPLADSQWPKDTQRLFEEERRFGPYRIVEKIGEGGMSRVYLARRDDAEFEQEVAIKLIRPVAAKAEVLRRFRVERQILANLQHPNIARLLDGGTTAAGTPYLVMEHIQGLPLTEYCERSRLSVDRRLELFRLVCDAVHHAHKRLVVHRDLKPGNILVSKQGEPKLLDFGIAKMLDPEAQGGSPNQASTWALTPTYASPEQMRGERITTASDVYSLGVVLYELLTGRLPDDGLSRSPAGVGSPEDLKEPLAPSRVLRSDLRDRAAGSSPDPDPSEVAATRATTPEKLERKLVGDLDTIVLHALRAEPDGRYGSVEQFSEDLGRYLDDLPVTARRPSRAYRLGKFVRRNALTVAATSLGLVLVLGFAVAAGVQSLRLARERDQARAASTAAERERSKAEAVTRFLTDSFETAAPSRLGASATVWDALDSTARRARNEPAGQPEIQATLMHTVGSVYTDLGLYEEAAPLLEDSLARRRQLFGNDHEGVAESLAVLSVLKTKTGELEEAGSQGREALEMFRRLLGSDHVKVADSLANLAELSMSEGEHEAAKKLMEQALTLHRERLGKRHPRVASDLNTLAEAHWNLGDVDTAEPLLEGALAIHREVHGEEHQSVVDDLLGIGVMHFFRSNYPQAESTLREALALQRRLQEDHPVTRVILGNLGLVLYRQGKYLEAEPLMRDTLDRSRATLGNSHSSTAGALKKLGITLQELGRYGEAISLFREALAIDRSADRGDPAVVADSLRLLGWVLQTQGRYGEAETLFREAVSLAREAFGDHHPDLAYYLTRLGNLLAERGAYEEAESLLREGLVLRERLLDENHELLASSLGSLGVLLRYRNAVAASVPLHRRATEIVRQHHGDSHPRTLQEACSLGYSVRDNGRPDEAERSFLEILEKVETLVGPAPRLAARTRLGLADLLLDRGRPEEARIHAREALTILSALLAVDDWRVAEAGNVLAASLGAQGRFEEAEPRLLESYLLLRGFQGDQGWFAQQALRRMVRFYDTWGRSAEAGRYRLRLSSP